MIRAVFLIKSPLQLLNAAEAKAYFGIKNEECLLLLIADRKSSPQLKKLVESDDSWENILALSETPLRINREQIVSSPRHRGEGQGLLRNDLFAIWKLRFLSNVLKDIEKVFIGDMGNPLMRHFANLLQDVEVVVLDDGTATLDYAVGRYSSSGEYRKPGLGKRIKLLFKRRLMGLRDQNVPQVTFFSVYEIGVKSPDRYVRNSFNALRQSIVQNTREDVVCFLGSPLVEANILSEEEFFQQLQRVVGLLKEENVVYIAHRREDHQRLTEIENRFGWKTVLFDYPVEYQLAKFGPMPRQLMSFFSSALENCQKIFGEELPIVAFKLSHEDFSRRDSPKGRQVENLYRHYETLQSDYFRIVSL